MDQDYINKLEPKDKQWLSNFNEEWLSGNFEHGGEILHKSQEQKRERWRSNNARARDTISVNRTVGWQELKSDMIDKHLANNHEDVIIELLDAKQKIDDAKLIGNKKRTKRDRNNSS